MSFKVNGQDLGPRISTGSGSVLRAGELGSAKFLYAYQSVQSGNLYVILGVKSRANKINVGSYEAKYRALTGRQSTASAVAGPTELAPHSSATIAMTFTGAKPGGVVTMPLLSENFETSRELQIKTR